MMDFETWLFLIFTGTGWIAAVAMYNAYDKKCAESNFYRKEFEKLSKAQNKAFEKVVNAHTHGPPWQKRGQLMPKIKRPLKLVASGGKRLYDTKVVSVDFRNKKKGSDDSGPKNSA